MSNQTFQKHERLLKRPGFQVVMNQGRKKRVDSFCTLFWKINQLEWSRLGIIASKKIGNAAVRNRTKRRIREIFRKNKGQIKTAKDIVVISGKGMDTVPFSFLEKKIVDVLRT